MDQTLLHPMQGKSFPISQSSAPVKTCKRFINIRLCSEITYAFQDQGAASGSAAACDKRKSSSRPAFRPRPFGDDFPGQSRGTLLDRSEIGQALTHSPPSSRLDFEKEFFRSNRDLGVRELEQRASVGNVLTTRWYE